MSFGLPLRDRILKWQLVSRVDSVSPVRGKKQQNQRTNISNIFEYSDERVRMALPERRVSSSGSQKQLVSLASYQRKQALPFGWYLLSTYQVLGVLQTLRAKKTPSSLFLPNLRLSKTETDGDFVFYQDKENKMWKGLMKKICTYFLIDRNPVVSSTEDSEEG